MKMHDIPLKRLTHKLKRTARKRLGKKDRVGQRATRHTALYKNYSHSIYNAHRAIPHKDGAKPEGEPRTGKAPRPKMAGLKDNSQQAAEKSRTTHPRTH